jgi:hypothetical protein
MINIKSIRNSLPLLLIATVMLLNWVFYPIRNHSEADDAYEFATNIRDLTPANLVENPAHRLYHVFTHYLWKIFGEPDALSFISALSLTYGLLAIVMVWLIAKQRWGLSMTSSVITALFFASIYSVWRYSHEVETYSLAWATSLFAMWLALGPRGKWAGGMIGGISTGFHIMCAVLVGPAVAVSLWVRDGFRPAVSYCVAVWIGLAIMFSIPWMIQKSMPEKKHSAWAIEGAEIPREETLLLNANGGSIHHHSPVYKIALRETFALGSTILASNWLFYNDSITQRLNELFPEKNITEESALGVRMPDFFFWISGFTFLLAVTVFLYICSRLFKRKIDQSAMIATNRLRLFNDWRFVLISIWLATYFVVQFVIGAGAPESWIPVLPSVALVFGLALSNLPSGRQAILGTLAITITFLHNFAGGIAPLRHKDWDLNFQQNEWLIQKATANDVVIGCNYLSVDRYLNWYCPAKTVQFSQCTRPDHLAHLMTVVLDYTKKSGGRIFVRNEVIRPPLHLRAKGYPDFSSIPKSWLDNGMLEKVADGDFPIFEYIVR